MSFENLGKFIDIHLSISFMFAVWNLLLVKLSSLWSHLLPSLFGPPPVSLRQFMEPPNELITTHSRNFSWSITFRKCLNSSWFTLNAYTPISNIWCPSLISDAKYKLDWTCWIYFNYSSLEWCGQWVTKVAHHMSVLFWVSWVCQILHGLEFRNWVIQLHIFAWTVLSTTKTSQTVSLKVANIGTEFTCQKLNIVYTLPVT